MSIFNCYFNSLQAPILASGPLTESLTTYLVGLNEVPADISAEDLATHVAAEDFYESDAFRGTDPFDSTRLLHKKTVQSLPLHQHPNLFGGLFDERLFADPARHVDSFWMGRYRQTWAKVIRAEDRTSDRPVIETLVKAEGIVESLRLFLKAHRLLEPLESANKIPDLIRAPDFISNLNRKLSPETVRLLSAETIRQTLWRLHKGWSEGYDFHVLPARIRTLLTDRFFSARYGVDWFERYIDDLATDVEEILTSTPPPSDAPTLPPPPRSMAQGPSFTLARGPLQDAQKSQTQISGVRKLATDKERAELILKIAQELIASDQPFLEASCGKLLESASSEEIIEDVRLRSRTFSELAKIIIDAEMKGLYDKIIELAGKVQRSHPAGETLGELAKHIEEGHLGTDYNSVFGTFFDAVDVAFDTAEDSEATVDFIYHGAALESIVPLLAILEIAPEDLKLISERALKSIKKLHEVAYSGLVSTVLQPLRHTKRGAEIIPLLEMLKKPAGKIQDEKIRRERLEEIRKLAEAS